MLSQEDAPQTHRATRQIARDIGIHRKDLRLKCLKKRRAQELTDANRDARLTRAKKLLRLYPQSAVDFIVFSDEKIFTVAPPVNPQNDRICMPQSTKKRDVAADRPTTPYTSNVQQVTDDLVRRVQARLHGTDFRQARG